MRQIVCFFISIIFLLIRRGRSDFALSSKEILPESTSNIKLAVSSTMLSLKLKIENNPHHAHIFKKPTKKPTKKPSHRPLKNTNKDQKKRKNKSKKHSTSSTFVPSLMITEKQTQQPSAQSTKSVRFDK